MTRFIHKDSVEIMKLAAFQELQDALKIKRVNDELLEFLASSLRWLIYYTRKNNLPLPEKDKIIRVLDRTMEISHKLPPNFQHPSKTPDDSTEQKY